MTDLRIESHDESYPPSLWQGSTLGSIAPTTAVVNVATAYVLTGTNFEPDSIVKVNGTTVPSTFVSATRINVAAYTASAVGSVNFTVTTNGKTTSPKPVVITATQEEPETPAQEPESFGEPIPVEELPE